MQDHTLATFWNKLLQNGSFLTKPSYLEWPPNFLYNDVTNVQELEGRTFGDWRATYGNVLKLWRAYDRSSREITTSWRTIPFCRESISVEDITMVVRKRNWYTLGGGYIPFLAQDKMQELCLKWNEIEISCYFNSEISATIHRPVNLTFSSLWSLSAHRFMAVVA